MLEDLPRAASRFFRDVPSENQEILHQQYVQSRVPRGQDKAVDGAAIVKHLGYIYNSNLALARLSNVRSLELCSIGFALLEEASASQENKSKTKKKKSKK